MRPKDKIRVDRLLVDLGLVPSRAKAQELIEEGHVFCKLSTSSELKKIKSCSEPFAPEGVIFEIKESPLLKYVSRAGLKLEQALKDFKIEVRGLTALDVGVSTGGFTDVLLQSEAKEVWGFDVGKDQIHERVLKNPKARIFEGVHLADFLSHKELSKRNYDLIVIDVSFISLKMALDKVLGNLKPGGVLLALIKPQFEVGPEHVGKGGVVKDWDRVQIVIQDYTKLLQDNGFEMVQTKPSGLKGRDGNQEYFLHGKKTSS